MFCMINVLYTSWCKFSQHSPQGKVKILLKLSSFTNVFCGYNFCFFTGVIVHRIRKSTKTETPKQTDKKITGDKMLRLPGLSRSKGRKTELINKEVWRKKKKKRCSEVIYWYITWKYFNSYCEEHVSSIRKH